MSKKTNWNRWPRNVAKRRTEETGIPHMILDFDGIMIYTPIYSDPEQSIIAFAAQVGATYVDRTHIIK